MPLDIPSTLRDFFTESELPLSLTDPNASDEPLILVNDAFCRITGYTVKEAVGRNCRFMQGKDTHKTSRNAIKGDFAANRDTKVLIRNYRKSGEAFDNYLFIFNIYDGNDKPLYRIGSQFVVPEYDRAVAFEAFTASLLKGLNAVNESGDFAQHQLIDTGDLAGISVKSLLMARLENLRSN